jgi:regulator of sigma E protease
MGISIISFIIVMSILVFVHELGHFVVAKRNHIVVEEFAFGFPPRLIKLGERDGTVYAINAIPFGGYVRMRGEDDPSQPGSLAAASRWARTTTLLAGSFMNLLLAVLLFSILAMLTGVPDLSKAGAVVGGTAPNSPAAQAGLQAGDRIISANGSPVQAYTDLQRITSANLGRSVTYEVQRANGQTVQLQMVPRVRPPAGEGALGVAIAPPPLRPAKPWEAIAAGFQDMTTLVYLTFQIPATLLREGKPIGDAGFMGPVGIAAVTGQVVQSSIAMATIKPLLSFMAALSTALGITNLLPIPGLDGGRLLFVIVEAIRRKRIEPMQEGMVHLIGLGLLLILVAMLTVREVTALITGTFPQITVH